MIVIGVKSKKKHYSFKYACEQCDYQASWNKNLKMQIESKHKGIKYNCDHCDYQFTDPGSQVFWQKV